MFDYMSSMDDLIEYHLVTEQLIIENAVLSWCSMFENELTIAMFPNEIQVLRGDIMVRHCEVYFNILRIQCFFEEDEFQNVHIDEYFGLHLALSEFSASKLSGFIGGYYAWSIMPRHRVYL